MKPRELFEVGTRLMGLWFVAQALEATHTLIEVWRGTFVPQRTPTSGYIDSVTTYAIIAALFLLCAPLLGRLFFGEASRGFDVGMQKRGETVAPPGEEA